jgi:hypothetical protein
MRKSRPVAVAALAALACLGASELLPSRVAEVAKAVESVRGRRFERPVPASEIEETTLRRTLRSKIAEGMPASPEDTIRTLVALGVMDDAPNVLDRLIDLYASQVVAFYDPEPRRFYVVKGGEADLASLGGGAASEKIVFAHELTHALQDESMQLDSRMKELKDNSDRSLALECLLEGEATIVMVRVAVADLPGAGEAAEEMMAPLLSAGALEKANVPKDVPDFFVQELFFPYVEGTAYVRAALKGGGWPAVDRLWKSPPASSAEILHGPGVPPPVENLLPKSLDGLAPQASRLLYADTLGEWTLRYLLRRTLPSDEADRAAAEWRGDRVAFFASGASVAYLWKIRCDGPGSADRLASALARARKGKKYEPTIERRAADVILTFGYGKPPL